MAADWPGSRTLAPAMGCFTCGHPSSLLSLLLSPEPGPDVDRSVQRWAREHKWVQARFGGQPRLTWYCDPLAQLCALGTPTPEIRGCQLSPPARASLPPPGSGLVWLPHPIHPLDFAASGPLRGPSLSLELPSLESAPAPALGGGLSVSSSALCPLHLRLGVCVAEGLCCLPREQSPHSQAPDRV